MVAAVSTLRFTAVFRLRLLDFRGGLTALSAAFTLVRGAGVVSAKTSCSLAFCEVGFVGDFFAFRLVSAFVVVCFLACVVVGFAVFNAVDSATRGAAATRFLALV